MKTINFSKRLLLSATAILIVALGFYSCKENKKSGNNSIDTNPPTVQQNQNDKQDEDVIINENYADSELYTFTGTIDEFYDDGSILIYSPDFSIEFDYKVIVEFDENTVIDNFKLKENQHIQFDVYSAVKKSKPLTVVASKLTLLNEVSTQREDEAKRIADLNEKAAKYNK